MEITDEAKSLITEALDSNKCDCLQVTLEQSCCGTSLSFALTKLPAGENPVFIDGVSVMMESQTQERAEKITLAVEDVELVIQDEAPSCCC